MKRTIIFAALAMTVMPAHAGSTAETCSTAVYINAVTMRASVACNEDWMDHPDVVALVGDIARMNCTKVLGGERAFRDIVVRDLRIFDSRVKAIGIKAACSQVSDAMKVFDK
jgi:hypothetical protein